MKLIISSQVHRTRTNEWKSQGDQFGDKVSVYSATVCALQTGIHWNSPNQFIFIFASRCQQCSKPCPHGMNSPGDHDNCSSNGCLQFVKPCTFSSGIPVSNSHKGTLCQGHTQILPWDSTNKGRAAYNAMSSWKSLTAWMIILSKILYNGFLNQTEADPWRSIQLWESVGP